MSDIAELSALDMAAAIRSGELSISEVTDRALAAAAEDEHGAFSSLDADYAYRSAAVAQQRLEDGDEAPLLGVPCPIKDLDEVAGLPYELGSAAFAGNIGARDDGIVTRLAEAGTVLLGKTSTPEFGLACYTEPDIAPPATTPWDGRRSAGGSSGGAGAAVASGVVPIAQGSDGGGSIRIPASCCGLVGLKPSRGVISPGPYGVDAAGLSTRGFLTTTVADTAAALDAVSRGWPGDHFSSADGGYLAALEAPPSSGLRIGLLTDSVLAPDTPVHPEAIAAATNTATLLAELGHRVEPAPAPFAAEQWDAFTAIWAVGAQSAKVPPGREQLLTPLARYLRESGSEITGLQLATALQAAQQLERSVANVWRDFDVIISPTLAQPPAIIGQLRNDADPAADFLAQAAYTPWTSIYNLVGRPAISLPLHRATVEGTELPFGVMLGAAAGQDALLLRLAASLEQAAPWPRHPAAITEN